MVSVKQKPASRGLGRGLSALIDSEEPVSVAPKAKTETKQSATDDRAVEGLLSVPLSQVVAGRYQPRQHFDEEHIAELAKSIKSNGVMQPIIVRSSKEFAGKFEIIAGERRYRASEKAGLKEVPVILRDLSDTQALELAIVENVQRQDLNPLEEAQGYQRLMEEFSYTQEKLAKSVGKSRSHIANLIRLLALPEAVKKYINEGKLSMGHARALLASDDAEKVAKQVISEELSVRQTEALVKAPANDDAPNQKPREISQNKSGKKAARIQTGGHKDEDILALETMLTENLGLKVEINDLGDQQGQIVISYDTLSQLDAVLQKLDTK